MVYSHAEERLGSIGRDAASLFAVGGASRCARGRLLGHAGVQRVARYERLQHVTLIGDSVATAIPGDTDAMRVLRQGSDLDLEVAPCRRLVDPSCPPNPPTVVDVIKRLGAAVGPTVVIAVGYNDFEDHYASEIDDTLAALDAASVKRIFWLTMRAAHHPYINMNDEIVAAAASRSEHERDRLERLLAQPSGLVPGRRHPPARARVAGDGGPDPRQARRRGHRRARPCA